MSSFDTNKDIKLPSRRSKKVKNLEEEVEFILSQDESDDDSMVVEKTLEILPKTPSRTEKIPEISTPRFSQAVLQEMQQTPRRSCRRSIKPTQEYDDIVSTRSRSVKKELIISEEAEAQEDIENPQQAQPKWTPAKVGRVSQKRGRKSRRTTKGKQKKVQKENEMKQKTEEEKEENIGNNTENEVAIEMMSEEKEQAKINLEEDKKTEEIKSEENFLTNNKTKEKTKNEVAIEMMGEEKEQANINLEEDKKTEEIKSEKNFLTNNKTKEKINENVTKSTEAFKQNEENIKISVEVEDMECFVQKNVDHVIGMNISNKHLNCLEKNSESLKEFMEIEELLNDQNLDESLHLIQEDSEDVKEEIEKQQTVVKIEEKENSLERSKKSSANKELEDSFGCYLKSKEINMSDLGLNPLNDDEVEQDEEKEKIKEEASGLIEESEEMPSLIICDDEDDSQENECMAKEKTNKLNETFEANDSVVIIEEPTKSPSKTAQETMECLKLSDDEGETPKKTPRIILTNSELENKTLLGTPNLPSTPKQKSTLKLPSTPKQLATPKIPSTPKQSTKAYRFPTPYRNRNNFKFTKEVPNSSDKQHKSLTKNAWMSSVTTLAPKDIILRGIRKRSLSVCIDGNDAKRLKFVGGGGCVPNAKQDRIVSFYSPANQTTIIDDLDRIIAKSLKKQKPIENKDISFVTTRRKRSMSVDDSLLSSSIMVSRLPRPVPSQNTPSKTQTSLLTKPMSRTKLPNFAAIHQKRFQKMESLVDHVSRKQERSKNLINSATKIRPGSAQKNISIVKSNIQNEKPKALKKIDLGVSKLQRPVNMKANATISSLSTTKLEENKAKPNNFPNPHLSEKKVVKAVVLPQRNPNYHQQAAATSSQQHTFRKYLNPTQSTNIAATRTNNTTLLSTSKIAKPCFNLSTSIMKTAPSSSSSSSPSMGNLNKTDLSNENKMSSRLQRHMDLFKGRVPATRAGVASRKNDAVIRGVRSNRRFELQMQHRKNMEN